MEGKKPGEVWIISEGRAVNLDLSSICKEPVHGPVIEYKISELASYLLNPNQISVEEKVVGCRISRRKSSSGRIKRLLTNIFSKAAPDNASTDVEEILSDSKIGVPEFMDEGLNAHLMRLADLLRPYDPVQKKLTGLDRENIEDVKAICEDLSGNRYRLNIQGGINDKLNYVARSLSKKVRVTLPRAFLLKGLFEMRGFDFQTFNAQNHFVVVKFMQKGKPGYCVLNPQYRFEYRVEDNGLINFIRLLQQALLTDPKLREAVSLCVKGEAVPLKLFFSEKLEHPYSEKNLPLAYRSVLDMYAINTAEKETLAGVLNMRQSIVTFNYLPKHEHGKKKVVINVSVLHDISALDPIKGRLPELYSEITKKAPDSGAGRLYLLDSMTGYQYV